MNRREERGRKQEEKNLFDFFKPGGVIISDGRKGLFHSADRCTREGPE